MFVSVYAKRKNQPSLYISFSNRAIVFRFLYKNTPACPGRVFAFLMQVKT